MDLRLIATLLFAATFLIAAALLFSIGYLTVAAMFVVYGGVIAIMLIVEGKFVD